MEPSSWCGIKPSECSVLWAGEHVKDDELTNMSRDKMIYSRLHKCFWTHWIWFWLWNRDSSNKRLPCYSCFFYYVSLWEKSCWVQVVLLHISPTSSAPPADDLHLSSTIRTPPSEAQCGLRRRAGPGQAGPGRAGASWLASAEQRYVWQNFSTVVSSVVHDVCSFVTF